MRVHIAQSIANEAVGVEGLIKRTTNEIKGVSEHVSRLEGDLWRINERIEEVGAVKRQIELEFEKLIKNKICCKIILKKNAFSASFLDNHYTFIVKRKNFVGYIFFKILESLLKTNIFNALKT